MRPVRTKTPRKAMARIKAAVKDPIVVYCRIRPVESPYDQVCVKAKDDKTVVVFQPDVPQSLKIVKGFRYSFQQVFNESTVQKELFDEVAYPLVQDLLQGNNGLLFTYGITSSGKTYTMTGTPEDSGLLPRSLDVIFNSIKEYQAPKFVFKPDKLNGFDIQSTAEALLEQQKELGIFNRTSKPKRRDNSDWSQRIADTSLVDDISPDMSYSVFISYVQVYQQYIYDLLEDDGTESKRIKFTPRILREDAAHNKYVVGAVETEVKSVEEALELFHKGQKRRKVASTALNADSSRSHCVFTIRVVQAPLDPQGAEVLQDKNQAIISQLSLVDLAGSERVLRTKNTGDQLKEGGGINKSLMVLRRCIEALRKAQTLDFPSREVIPYREDKLTHLFKTFFEGEGKIRVVVCVNPSSDNYNEIFAVMQFAEMTQEVMVSRPTPAATPNTLVLKPGRRQLYQDAQRKAHEQGVHVSEILSPVVYTLGPDFPSLTFHSFGNDSDYNNLLQFLDNRIVRRTTLMQDICRKQDDFRNNLIAIDKENLTLKQEKTVLQMDLDAREQQVRGLERKLSAAEQSAEILEKQLQETQHQVQTFRMEMDHKERRIGEQGREMENIKSRMQDKLASEKDRLKRIMERRLAAKQAELERKMCMTDEKFRQLREILNADDWEYVGEGALFSPLPPPSTTTVTSSETASEVSSVPPRTRASSKRRSDPASSEGRFTKAKSAIDFVRGSSRHNTPHASHPSSSRNDFDVLYAKENKTPGSSQRSVAIANLRHRRSQSSSADVWIEHKPIGNLELNTVLKPSMRKKKSVSKLTIKDVTNSDVSKYVLQHQEQDSQGEVETQLYKGDVIPSAGGGAQIVFNDVEKLKQTSPPAPYNLRKRSGDNMTLREVEDRCTMSVECHGLPSKILKKK